jgi:hypothetical protein
MLTSAQALSGVLVSGGGDNPNVITDNDTIQGNGKSSAPIKLKKIYFDRTDFTGDGLSENTKIQLADPLHAGYVRERVTAEVAELGIVSAMIDNLGDVISFSVSQSGSMNTQNVWFDYKHLVLRNDAIDYPFVYNNTSYYYRQRWDATNSAIVYEVVDPEDPAHPLNMFNVSILPQIDATKPLLSSNGYLMCKYFTFPDDSRNYVDKFTTTLNWDDWDNHMIANGASVKWAIENKVGANNIAGGNFVPVEVKEETASLTITTYSTKVSAVVKTSDKTRNSIQIHNALQYFNGTDYVDSFYTLAQSDYNQTLYEISLKNVNDEAYRHSNLTTFTPKTYESTLISIDINEIAKNVTNTIKRYVEYKQSPSKSENYIEMNVNDPALKAQAYVKINPGNIYMLSSAASYVEINQFYLKEQSSIVYLNAISNDGEKNIQLTLNTTQIEAAYNTNTMFTCSPRSDSNECDFYVHGDIHAENIQSSMTITHKTDVSDCNLGRFCESTGLIFSKYEEVGIKDCITGVKLATTLNTKILGIVTSETQFASHGDVLVKVVDGEYHLGDLLVPTENGARVATEEEKLFIMLNGLPKVRVMSITDNRIPKISEQVCVAAFIS